jgi:hypothetical protein
MSKRAKSLLVLSSLAVLAGTVWLSSGSVVNSKSPFVPGPLEEKARKAKGGDEDAVRDLTEQVFYEYQGMLPAEVLDGAKERVVRAEMEYRKNGKGGVREAHVAAAVNFLADKFHAPDFAKADERQVKVLRARLRSGAPSFFAPEPDNKKGLKKKIGQQMNPEVSPLEATSLMLVMLTQKASNDEFQQTPEEFAVRVRRKPSRLVTDMDGPTLVANDPRNIEKTRSVIHAATEGLSHMSVTDAINLTADTFDRLGIKK